ncbi:Nif3-like dinuclear metal center hexameric protein, partial [Streptomyces sp. NPDC127044]
RPRTSAPRPPATTARPAGATEWPWCELAAAQLDEISDRKGWGLRVHVSKTVTDPWTAHAASTETPNAMGAPN